MCLQTPLMLLLKYLNHKISIYITTHLIRNFQIALSWNVAQEEQSMFQLVLVLNQYLLIMEQC